MYRYKTVRVGKKRVPSHRVIWENATGKKIPPGYEIHHIDGDGKNNSIENLMMLSHAEHMALHAKLRREGTDVVDSTNPDVIHARNKSKTYARTHKAKLREYREMHQEERSSYNALYYSEHRDAVKLTHELYRKSHMSEFAERARKYRAANRPLVNALQNLRNAKRRGCSPEELEVYKSKVEEARLLVANSPKK